MNVQEALFNITTFEEFLPFTKMARAQVSSQGDRMIVVEGCLGALPVNALANKVKELVARRSSPWDENLREIATEACKDIDQIHSQISSKLSELPPWRFSSIKSIEEEKDIRCYKKFIRHLFKSKNILWLSTKVFNEENESHNLFVLRAFDPDGTPAIFRAIERFDPDKTPMPPWYRGHIDREKGSLSFAIYDYKVADEQIFGGRDRILRISESILDPELRERVSLLFEENVAKCHQSLAEERRLKEEEVRRKEEEKRRREEAEAQRLIEEEARRRERPREERPIANDPSLPRYYREMMEFDTDSVDLSQMRQVESSTMYRAPVIKPKSKREKALEILRELYPARNISKEEEKLEEAETSIWKPRMRTERMFYEGFNDPAYPETAYVIYNPEIEGTRSTHICHHRIIERWINSMSTRILKYLRSRKNNINYIEAFKLLKNIQTVKGLAFFLSNTTSLEVSFLGRKIVRVNGCVDLMGLNTIIRKVSKIMKEVPKDSVFGKRVTRKLTDLQEEFKKLEASCNIITQMFLKIREFLMV